MTGWHGRADRAARGVRLYLLPGLTTGQRRAVIRRLRQEASRGFGPPLPLPQLTVALGLDRVRTEARIARAIVRLHPAVTLLPGALVVAVMALFVIASSDGAASTPKARAGLAEATRAGGAKNPRVFSARPGRPQTDRVTVAVRADAGLVGTGLGTGQRIQVRHAGGTHPHAPGPGHAAVRSGAWYIGPQAMTGPVPHRSGDG